MMFAIKKKYKFNFFALACVLSVAPLHAMAVPIAKIAIIIDDMGYRKTDNDALNLDGNFTYAILPFAPQTQKIARAAHAKNREVMAHIPMEALKDNHLLGKGAIYSSMTQQQLSQLLLQAINNVPYAQGVNNHMGSRLTSLSEPMHWMMELLSKQQLYFLDSKTSATSVAEKVAKKFGLATAHRHVFLDNKLDSISLNKQFERLISIAQKHQFAIAIAHPHPETIKFLANISDRLTKLNIKLVPLSEVLITNKNKELKPNSQYTDYPVF